jgi:hypothetical protein
LNLWCGVIIFIARLSSPGCGTRTNDGLDVEIRTNYPGPSVGTRTNDVDLSTSSTTGTGVRRTISRFGSSVSRISKH